MWKVTDLVEAAYLEQNGISLGEPKVDCETIAWFVEDGERVRNLAEAFKTHRPEVTPELVKAVERLQEKAYPLARVRKVEQE